MPSLSELKRIAEIEFEDIVVFTEFIDYKLRIQIKDKSFTDVYLSRRIQGRFSFHWERGHIDGAIFRYDNYPNTEWRNVSTFPYHFHNGFEDSAVKSPFDKDILKGFKEFMKFIREKIK